MKLLDKLQEDLFEFCPEKPYCDSDEELIYKYIDEFGMEELFIEIVKAIDKLEQKVK